MTAPVDPVGALARLLIDTSDQFHREMSAWREGGEIINWGNVWLAMARAALARARALVPEPQQYRRVADPTHVDGWNACRAETLRRLGGEGI